MGFQCAFDTVSHTFLWSCLEKIGIPPVLRKAIQTIYLHSTSQVLINGFLTPCFPLRRGVRQGCPLSMLLFTIVIETLIRKLNATISGLSMFNERLVCRAYADDVFVLITNPAEIYPTLNVLSNFQNVSGTSVNWTKSKYLALGSWSTPIPQLLSSPFIKVLGIVFYNRIALCIQVNWSNVVHKVHIESIKSISKRLNLFQRIWYSNTYLLSKIWFLARVLPPRKLDTQTLEKYIGYHVWRNHPYRISRDQLRLPRKKGGLGLVDIELKCKALLIRQYDNLARGFGDPFELSYLQQYLNPSSSRFRQSPSFIRAPLESREALLVNNNQCLNTSKSVYNTLLENKNIHTSIEGKHPSYNWPCLWKNVLLSPLSSDWRSSLYLVVNECISCADKLFRHGRSQSNICPFCTQIETLCHKLYECNRIKPIWTWVLGYFTNKIKLPLPCINKICKLQFDFNYIKSSRYACMWTLAGYINYIVTSQRPLLADFISFLRRERWQMIKDKNIMAFENKLFFF